MTDFSKRNRSVKNKLSKAAIAGTIAALLMSISPAAFAIGTAANSKVTNSFTLDYTAGGAQQATVSNQDDEIEFIVDRVIDLTVDSLGDKITMPGALGQDLVFSLSNTGNDLQAYNLRIVNENGDHSDDHFDVTNIEILICQDDGDGIFEPGGDDGQFIPHNTRAQTQDLAADAVLWVAIRAAMPAAGLTTGQRGKVTLIAETMEASIKESSGKPLSHEHNTHNTQENYFADQSGTSHEQDGNGDHSASAFYTIDAPNLSAENAITIHSQTGEGCFDFSSAQQEGFAIPGACVEYMFTIENTGGTFAAEDISFVNTLDETLKFAMARMSGFSGGAIAHPAMEQDCASADCNISISNAALAPGEIGVVTIRALLK